MNHRNRSASSLALLLAASLLVGCASRAPESAPLPGIEIAPSINVDPDAKRPVQTADKINCLVDAHNRRQAQELQTQLAPLISEASGVAFAVADLRTGLVCYANAEEQFVMASIVKVSTAMALIDAAGDPSE